MSRKHRRKTVGFYRENGKTKPITGRLKKESRHIIRRIKAKVGNKMTVYLTKDSIEAIHERVLSETSEEGYVKERARVLNPGLLDLALDLPSQRLYGVELYPTVWDKAAVYLTEIIRLHVFEGANKRTAFLAAYSFLRLNGYELSLQDEDVEGLCLAIAQNQISFGEVSETLKRSSQEV